MPKKFRLFKNHSNLPQNLFVATHLLHIFFESPNLDQSFNSTPCPFSSSFATTSCHNTNEPPRRFQQEPVYPDSDWQQRMLEDELPLELPVGARRPELGRFRESGAVDGTWCVCNPGSEFFVAFFHDNLKVPPNTTSTPRNTALLRAC